METVAGRGDLENHRGSLCPMPQLRGNPQPASQGPCCPVRVPSWEWWKNAQGLALLCPAQWPARVDSLPSSPVPTDVMPPPALRVRVVTGVQCWSDPPAGQKGCGGAGAQRSRFPNSQASHPEPRPHPGFCFQPTLCGYKNALSVLDWPSGWSGEIRWSGEKSRLPGQAAGCLPPLHLPLELLLAP